MVSSRAVTVDDYLAELPAERRAVMSAVRDAVRRALPRGYAESMTYGMIGWSVPLARYPDTYNGQPLCYAGLAAQKHHYALYLMAPYQDPAELAWMEAAWRESGCRLDMGKSCIRFKSLDDLPLDVVARVVARTPPDAFIARHEAARRRAVPAARGAASATRPRSKRGGSTTASSEKGASGGRASERGPTKRAPTRRR